VVEGHAGAQALTPREASISRGSASVESGCCSIASRTKDACSSIPAVRRSLPCGLAAGVPSASASCHHRIALAALTSNRSAARHFTFNGRDRTVSAITRKGPTIHAGLLRQQGS
jgi:hypothetical protein